MVHQIVCLDLVPVVVEPVPVEVLVPVAPVEPVAMLDAPEVLLPRTVDCI